jgi:hypothetical protein
MRLSKLKTIFLTACILSLLALPLWAVNDNAGTTGFSTLKLVMSARALAMGQGLTGEVRNPDGLHFNPASIIGIDGNEVNSTYTSSFLDTQGGQLQYLYPKNKFIAWGFALKYMNMGTFDRTEIDQNGDLVETNETFGAYNLIASASMAKYISNAIDLGGTFKVIYDQIDNESATAVMFDLGAIHHPANKKVQIGLSVRNLGFQTSFYTAEKTREKLPVSYAGGISYAFNDRLNGDLDLSIASGENLVAKLGVEYALNPALKLRGGFRSNAGDGYAGGVMYYLSGLSLGAGWKWHNYRIDYGVTSYGDLGLINQLSLCYEF